jgi:uncharacterized protein (DUF488 family)
MRFFTLGYGGRTPDEIVALLQAHGVRTVVDVRLRPDRASMGRFVAAKTPDKGIARWIAAAGVSYVPAVELGNVFMDAPDWRERYRALMDASGALLTARLATVEPPFCLLCAEKRVADCHRQVIADQLERSGWKAEHIE